MNQFLDSLTDEELNMIEYNFYSDEIIDYP